ncbi:hypothetical protein BDW68DRAFT_192237 [Aspergillus falconensis]
MIVQSLLLLALSFPAMGSALIADPSNTADLAADSEGCYNGRLQHRQRRPYCEDANDTSVLVATPRATSLASTRPSIANSSTAHIENSNITVHDGAANIFAYGTGTTVCVRNTGLRSSGPASHGLYAAGNGKIYASNIRHYSGSNLCSSYSGDTPARYVYVRNAVAHTAGAGSAIFYALGEVYGADIGLAEKAPIDGGTVMFPSAERQSGASVSLENSRLTTLRKGHGLLVVWRCVRRLRRRSGRYVDRACRGHYFSGRVDPRGRSCRGEWELHFVESHCLLSWTSLMFSATGAARFVVPLEETAA